MLTDTEKAAALHKALLPFTRERGPQTDREIASHFHRLAMAYVRGAVERRRWLKRIGSAERFYADLWCADRTQTAKGYRDLARKHRRLARGVTQ